MVPHPLPVGGGTGRLVVGPKYLPFQSALPVWGGTPTRRKLANSLLDFNPPSPCGKGHIFPCSKNRRSLHFNPPSPCGEGPGQNVLFTDTPVFQSTLPARGGTIEGMIEANREKISIHPPRVGRDKTVVPKLRCLNISIHPPRVGRD